MNAPQRNRTPLNRPFLTSQPCGIPQVLPPCFIDYKENIVLVGLNELSLWWILIESNYLPAVLLERHSTMLNTHIK